MKTLEDALAAIEELKTAHEAEKTRILAKNKELVDREKEAKRLADEAEEAREEADRLANEKSGDIEKIKADLQRQHTRDLKKLTDQLATKTAKLETLLIDNTINESLTANNVLPHFAPAVRAMLKAGAKMDENGDVTVDGVAFADRLSEFYASPDARHYVAAPVNNGGGAQGSNAKASAWTKAPETADEYSRFMQESLADPSTTNALADTWGRPDLKV